MGMFDFLNMMGNHEARKVERFEKGKLIIDTCIVTDSSWYYETAIAHPSYKKGEWIIVEGYDAEKQAKKGHNKWVKAMTAKVLPKSLKDVSTCEAANAIREARSLLRKAYASKAANRSRAFIKKADKILLDGMDMISYEDRIGADGKPVIPKRDMLRDK